MPYNTPMPNPAANYDAYDFQSLGSYGNGFRLPPRAGMPQEGFQMPSMGGSSEGFNAPSTLGQGWGRPAMGLQDMGNLGSLGNVGGMSNYGGYSGLGQIAGAPIGGGGNWLSQARDWGKDSGLLDYQDAAGNKTSGALGPLAGLAQAGMGAFLGMQQYGLAKEQFAANKENSERNFRIQQQRTNSQLEDRQQARVASNAGAYQSVGAYMAANRVA